MLCFDNWAAPASSRWTRRRITFHLVITGASCQKQKPQSVKQRNGSHGKKGPRQNDKCRNLPETKEKSELTVKLTNQCDATKGRRQQRKHLAEHVRMLQCSARKPSYSNTMPVGQTGKSKTPETFTTQTPHLPPTSELTFIAPFHCHRLLPSCHPELRVPAAAAVNHCNIVVVKPPQGPQVLPPPGAVVLFPGSQEQLTSHYSSSNKTTNGAITCRPVDSGCCFTEI